MAFSDPQSVTINAVPFTLNRTGSGQDTGTFMTSDGNVKMSVSHSYGRRNRRTIRLDHRKVAADPLNSAQNLNYSMAVYLVADIPPIGYSPTEAQQILDGFVANLQASTKANEVKFFGGEA